MSGTELDLFHFDEGRTNFESLGKENGFRHWFARELMKWLDYTNYTTFKKAINKAMTVCSTLDIDIPTNFKQTTRIVDQVPQHDYQLSKFACYLVIMNADVKKKQVAKAQAYFITYTESFKKYIKDVQQVERIVVRGEISEREKSLSAVVSNADIQNYALFRNKGYRGLYNMSINQLKRYKGIPNDKTPLDFMGREELAANLFRITQTEAKIRNRGIKGQKNLEDTAFSVGWQVRNVMETISGTKPENLPIDTDIKSVKATIKSTQKEFTKIERSKK